MQHDETSAVDADNWFKTGDVASIDPLGFMRITDRSKDVIKSGGEWISSIDIENAAMSHHQVKQRLSLAATCIIACLICSVCKQPLLHGIRPSQTWMFGMSTGDSIKGLDLSST